MTERIAALLEVRIEDRFSGSRLPSIKVEPSDTLMLSSPTTP